MASFKKQRYSVNSRKTPWLRTSSFGDYQAEISRKVASRLFRISESMSSKARVENASQVKDASIEP